MKTRKVLLGLGAACAACCALPIAGTLAALGAVTSALLAASAGGWLPAAGLALLAIAAGVGLLARKRGWRAAACSVDGACGCSGAACR